MLSAGNCRAIAATLAAGLVALAVAGAGPIGFPGLVAAPVARGLTGACRILGGPALGRPVR